MVKEALNNDKISFYNLDWDTEFFGVNCAKAIIKKPLNLTEWRQLKTRFSDYDFVSIENRDSESLTARYIGNETSAYLVDINIQFTKKIEAIGEWSCTNITVHQELEGDKQLLEMANFPFSRFTEDPQLAKRGGSQVYREWLKNSFNRKDKSFILYRSKNDEVMGYLLYSFLGKLCVIELIAVSQVKAKSGIGTKLFRALEHTVYNKGAREIRVGTQVKNLNAINFYHKLGCKQVGCHQVYHLWND